MTQFRALCQGFWRRLAVFSGVCMVFSGGTYIKIIYYYFFIYIIYIYIVFWNDIQAYKNMANNRKNHWHDLSFRVVCKMWCNKVDKDGFDGVVVVCGLVERVAVVCGSLTLSPSAPRPTFSPASFTWLSTLNHSLLSSYPHVSIPMIVVRPLYMY